MRYMRIVGVAMRMCEGEVISLPAPSRHWDLRRHILASRPDWKKRIGDEEGFITECGRFLSRSQACHVAHVNGQSDGRRKDAARHFTSEELW